MNMQFAIEFTKADPEGKVYVIEANPRASRTVPLVSKVAGIQMAGIATKLMLGETVKRELLEETGYSVTPMRLSGIYERISEGRRDGNSHKIYFIFLCRLDGDAKKAPSETDRFQIGCEWIDLKEAHRRNLFPRAIRDNLSGLIGRGETIFIGSEKDRI